MTPIKSVATYSYEKLYSWQLQGDTALGCSSRLWSPESQAVAGAVRPAARKSYCMSQGLSWVRHAGPKCCDCIVQRLLHPMWDISILLFSVSCMRPAAASQLLLLLLDAPSGRPNHCAAVLLFLWLSAYVCLVHTRYCCRNQAANRRAGG